MIARFATGLSLYTSYPIIFTSLRDATLSALRSWEPTTQNASGSRGKARGKVKLKGKGKTKGQVTLAARLAEELGHRRVGEAADEVGVAAELREEVGDHRERAVLGADGLVAVAVLPQALVQRLVKLALAPVISSSAGSTDARLA